MQYYYINSSFLFALFSQTFYNTKNVDGFKKMM